MRRPTLVVLLALSSLIPQVHAQGAAPDSGSGPLLGIRATFGVAPLAVPRNPALDPGGRLGRHTIPALVAAEWQRRLLASLPAPDRLGVAAVGSSIAAAAPAPFVPPPPRRRPLR